MMQGFRSVGGLQRFISVFSAVRNLFVAPHHKRSALAVHIHRIRAMAQWKAVAGANVTDKSILRALLKQRDIAHHRQWRLPAH